MSDVATIIPARETDPVSDLLMRAALDPAFDAQKFEIAVSFIREREAKAERRAYNKAMARISEQLELVPRKGKNSYLSNKYGKKDDMLKVIKPIAADNGVGLRFGSQPPAKPGNQCITLITSLGAYEEVTSLEGPITMPPPSRDSGRRQMNEMQAVGSATTYLERYLLGMVFSLVLADEQDDDGEATRNKTEAPPESTPPDDLRETINRDVPLGKPGRKQAAKAEDEAAAEEKQRQAGYAAILEQNEIDIEPLYTLAGYKWIEHLQTMLNNAPARDAVEAIGGHTVVSQVMQGMPPAVKEKVTDMLADAMGRFPNEQWTQPPAEDLDELPPIVGEKNVMAG